MTSVKDIERIKKIQKGDSSAFESLYHEFYAALCAYSKLVVNRSDVAEDIVQELFFKIWNKKENLNITTSLKAYLYRSVYNNSIDYLRSEKLQNIYKDYNLGELDLNPNVQPDTDMIEIINKAIDELPDKSKEVFKMRKFDKMSHKEIGEKLNISHKTVETHIHRATTTLKEKLKNLYIAKLILIFLHIV